jgi:DNA modification methylase
MQWPADQVERRPVAELIPSARNARTHSDEQVAQIAASIREWGWTTPVLVDEAGTIIAGHGRVLAAGRLGLAEVPVMVARGWSEGQKGAYRIADNKLGLNAGWNDELLRVELADLATMGFDLPLVGFSERELSALNASGNAGLTDPDEVPEAPAEPVTRLGDVWALGRHRLLCGDATCAEDVGTVLDGVQPHLMVTDPPYGVEYDAKWRLEAGVNKDHQVRAEGKVSNDHRADWREAWVLFPGDVIYCWHSGKHSSIVEGSLSDCGFLTRSQIIWAKQALVIGRGHYHWQHESCWYAVRKGATGHWVADHRQSTLWPIPNVHRTQGDANDGRTTHSAQKPVECMKRPIENNSSPGQAVYDPFVGSGTTIIAAEMTGRACYAIEIDPAYCDVAVTRWENFTGQKAERILTELAVA